MSSEPPSDPLRTLARITSEDDRDNAFIEGLCKNDETAFAGLYDLYGGLAYSLALQILRGRTEAEDVVQESFLALWRQAERLEAGRNIRGYLMTIVQNKAIDRLRQRKRRKEINLETANEVASESDPAVEAELGSERSRVRQALAALSSEQRSVLEATYFGGFTMNEAAQRLRVPLGTVKSRLRLALAHLKAQMGGLQ